MKYVWKNYIHVLNVDSLNAEGDKAALFIRNLLHSKIHL